MAELLEVGKGQLTAGQGRRPRELWLLWLMPLLLVAVVAVMNPQQCIGSSQHTRMQCAGISEPSWAEIWPKTSSLNLSKLNRPVIHLWRWQTGPMAYLWLTLLAQKYSSHHVFEDVSTMSS